MQQCKQISDGCLEKFKRIITLIIGTGIFLLSSIWSWMHLVVTAFCFSILACMYRGETAISSLNWSRGIFFFFPWWWFPEGFVTQWAAEVSLSCMTSGMCFQIARSCKIHLTWSTNEWFLSCMSSWMCFKTVMSYKRLWTQSTTEWFLSCMNSWMSFQMANLWKRLQTESTTEWFLSCDDLGLVLMWILSRNESLKDLSHNKHLKCLSEWTLKWYFRMSDVGKDLVHCVQKRRFSLKLLCLKKVILKM